MLVAPFIHHSTPKQDRSHQQSVGKEGEDVVSPRLPEQISPFMTPARLLTFNGVDDSPSDQHPDVAVPNSSYCPLCMQYFEGVYLTSCCAQHICGNCGTGLVREAAKKAATLQTMLMWTPPPQQQQPKQQQQQQPLSAVARRQQERDEERTARQQLLLSALNMNLILDAPYFKEEFVLGMGAAFPRPTSVASASSASDVGGGGSRSSSSQQVDRPLTSAATDVTSGSTKYTNFGINVGKVASLVSVVCPYCFRFLKVRPCARPLAAVISPAKTKPLTTTTTVAINDNNDGGGGFESHSPPAHREASLLGSSPAGVLQGGGSVRRQRGPYTSMYSSTSPNSIRGDGEDLSRSPFALSGTVRIGFASSSSPSPLRSSPPYPVSVRGLSDGGQQQQRRQPSAVAAGPASRYVRQSRALVDTTASTTTSDDDEDFSLGDSASLRIGAATVRGGGPPLGGGTTPSPEATEPAGPSTPLASNHRNSHTRAMVVASEGSNMPTTPSPGRRLNSHVRGGSGRGPNVRALPPVSLSEPHQAAAATRHRVPPRPHARSHNDTQDALRPDLFVADTFVGPRSAHPAGSHQHRPLLRPPPPLPPPVSSPRRAAPTTAAASPYLLRRPASHHSIPNHHQQQEEGLRPHGRLPSLAATPVRGAAAAVVPPTTGPSPVRAGDDFGEMQRKLMLQLTTNSAYRAQFSVDFESLRAVERNMPRTPARTSLPPVRPVPDQTRIPPVAPLPLDAPPARRNHNPLEGRRRGSSTAHVPAPAAAGAASLLRQGGGGRSASQPVVQAQRRVAAINKDDRWCPVM